MSRMTYSKVGVLIRSKASARIKQNIHIIHIKISGMATGVVKEVSFISWRVYSEM